MEQILATAQQQLWGLLLWLIPFLLVLTALPALLLPLLKGRAGEAAVGAALENIAEAVVHDLVLISDDGSPTQIDHIARFPGGLLVVETKNLAGPILGTEREPRWTQCIGRRPYPSLQNPLRQNYKHIKAVEHFSPGVPIEGLVVFTNRSSFPKGRPPGVSQLSSLRRDIAGLLPRVPGNSKLEDVWQRLQNPALSSPEAKRAHLKTLRQRFGPDRRALRARVMLGIAGLWSATVWSLYGPPFGQSPSPSAASIAPTSAPAAWPTTAHPSSTASVSSRVEAPPRWPARPASAPRPTTPAVAELRWSRGEGAPAAPAAASHGCALARADLLIRNSDENRQRRDFACLP